MRVRTLIIVCLGLLAAGCATAPKPSADAAPPHVHALSSRPLRVMTFNIQSGRRGLHNVAALIREAAPDVVGLQEVDVRTRRSGGVDQMARLAWLAGYAHRAFFATTPWRGGEYGLGIISHHPIVEARQYELPTRLGMEPRAVGRAILAIDGAEVSVYVTHLSNRGDRAGLRAAQARFIARLMSEDPRPKILMGDLNDAPDSAALLLLERSLNDAFSRAGHGSAETYPLPLFLPHRRLDYVLLSPGLTPCRSWVMRRSASDHFPLVTDLELESGGGSLAAAAGRP